MKKILLMLSLCMFLTISLSAQALVGGAVWSEKYGWEEGLTNVVPFDYYPGGYYEAMQYSPALDPKPYLIVGNSNAGYLRIYKVNDDGSIGEMTDEKIGLSTGLWGMTAYPNFYDYTYYFLISYASTGDAESYELTKEGKFGKKIWSTNRWEKGITEVEAFTTGIFLYKPDAGWHWVFEIGQDGAPAAMKYHSKNWVTNIKFSVFDKFNLFMTNGDGVAWVYTWSGGKLHEMWKTTNYEKGITVPASNYFENSSYAIPIYAPSSGYAWLLGYSNKNVDVKWSNHAGWEKGITNQAVIGAGSYLFLHKPDIGRAWVYDIQ